MKILVLSDSHASRSFMRHAITALTPDAVVHLGDYYTDGEVMQEEFPNIQFHLVPGNCDRNRMLFLPHETLCYDVCGVRLYMTHGHKHAVKSDTHRLLADAEKSGAQIVMYGHTHQAECYQTENGMWVLNPGSCRTSEGSVGVVEIEGEKISACYLLKQTDIF